MQDIAVLLNPPEAEDAANFRNEVRAHVVMNDMLLNQTPEIVVRDSPKQNEILRFDPRISS